MKRPLAIIATIFMSLQLWAQNEMPSILPMRERAAIIDQWLEERMEQVLPDLMSREKIDMWIIIAREYNEDPVIETMLPATWLSARRRTILLLYDQGEDKGVERLAVARYNVGKSFTKSWEKEQQPEQWDRLVELIEQRDPQRIAVNRSDHFALADGISATEYQKFMEVLPQQYKDRVVSGENLAVGWLETRTVNEMEVYKDICAIAHRIIAEGFSSNVIKSGETTTDDLVWWYRDRIRELGLTAWFHPSVSIQRADPESFDHLRSFSERPEHQVISPGDLLHLDFGITYLKLNTDTQQHAYVLKSGEIDAPEYLKKALADGNKLQDIFTNEFKEGRTGNEILASAIEQAIKQGLKPTIYTHPIGYHGHGAGPTIGLWDQQEGVPGRGDYRLYYNTAYSIELNNATYIPDWKKEIRIMLEEDAFFDKTGVQYIDGRQTVLHLISSTNKVD
ncbi:MAG: M24 family metallopeptidase [Bacteroidetes bacterium]|nr:M24 family metallopeptidase [Bacteroidota bacterium]